MKNNTLTLNELHTIQQAGEVINYRLERTRKTKEPNNAGQVSARHFIMGCDNLNELYSLYEKMEAALDRAPTQFEYMMEYYKVWLTYLQKPGTKYSRSPYWGDHSAESWDDMTAEGKHHHKTAIRERAANAWAGKTIERHAVEQLMSLQTIAGYTVKRALSSEFLDRVLGADIVLTIENKKGKDVLLYVGISSTQSIRDYKKKKNTPKRAHNKQTGKEVEFVRDMNSRSRLFLTYDVREISAIPFHEVGKLPVITLEQIAESIAEKMKKSEEHPELFETVGRSPNLDACREFYRQTDGGKSLNR